MVIWLAFLITSLKSTAIINEKSRNEVQIKVKFVLGVANLIYEKLNK